MRAFTHKIRHILILIFLSGLGLQMVSARNFESSTLQENENNLKEIKGAIIDATSKKPLVFATINLLESNISTITNTEGNFVLKVPSNLQNGKIAISFLGYQSKEIALSTLTNDVNTIFLSESVTELGEINLTSFADVSDLVKAVFKNKADNYQKDPTVMTAFYRENIKKRNRNVSLSEAVVNIYKTPYGSRGNDDIKIFKARKSTDYKRLDTVAFKLQGGPFNSLFLDVIKYPEYLFSTEMIEYYNFRLNRATEINGQTIYVIHFEQKSNADGPLYVGKLFIEPTKKILVSAVYSLNITDVKEASKIFVRKKPRNATVYPKEVVYRVDYKESNGTWHYSYGNAMLKFKIDWDKKLFNSIYTMNCEMAITDWRINTATKKNKKDLIKSSIILSDQVSGFSDPNFWGANNIIEPEKNIESAIKKIRKQLQKSKASPTAFAAP